LSLRSFPLTALLLAASSACLGYAGLILGEARWFDVTEQERLRRESWGEPTGSLHGSLAVRCRQAAAQGRSWARIRADRVALSAPVVEGTGRGQLRLAVGHLPGSAFPGERGNVVLAGHRDMHFAPLRKVQVGDRLSLITPDGTFEYVVTGVSIVDPYEVEIEQATPPRPHADHLLPVRLSRRRSLSPGRPGLDAAGLMALPIP
jgi:LPXTG-site transpeptidase (sortase) family protein